VAAEKGLFTLAINLQVSITMDITESNGSKPFFFAPYLPLYAYAFFGLCVQSTSLKG